MRTFFIVLAFFGTGNVASINSFDPFSVHCYITIIIPGIMGPLMIYKMLCPMFCVSAALALITRPIQKSVLNSPLLHGLVCVAISNVMAIHFFCWLRDQGSWLDIGISISHYVIAMSFGLLSMVLAYLGNLILPLHRNLNKHLS
ncbi:hypothetical protein Ciccas_005462 [Cichlidogyrus casuarinus]|uniref:GPI ethanolamine phosphate transferase 1 n=1 Tax=Cichlidogyrus casuarinus TaxID=1844966 RepID=A0ABD2Q906_9PLAT